jgi:hypothetical protein
MSDTVGHHGLEVLGQIARQCVTHLDRRPELRRPLPQHVGQVLTGVLAAREERDLPPFTGRNDPRVKTPRSGCCLELLGQVFKCELPGIRARTFMVVSSL